jgi:hypothetical protein
MAQLATGAIGAVIGHFTPMGAYWGWTIGVAIGTILFPPKIPDQVGPRLGEKTFQVSTYGAPIPIIYGTMRLTGNVIWGAEIIEKTHVEELGKSGASATSVSYSYYGSFAVGVCAGEAKLLRMWANGKLIYDITSISLETVKSNLDFTWYEGTETQLPDPVIESFEGVGAVPGHRGLAYIVFDEIPLADYGNGIPRLSFEVAREDAALLHCETDSVTPDEMASGVMYTDWDRMRAYTFDMASAGLGVMDRMYVTDLETMTTRTILRAEMDAGDGWLPREPLGILPLSGNLLCTVENPASGANYVCEWSPDTFIRLTDTLHSFFEAADGHEFNTSRMSGGSCGFGFGSKEFVTWHSQLFDQWVYQSGEGIRSELSVNRHMMVVPMLPHRATQISKTTTAGGFYGAFVTLSGGGGNMSLYRYEVTSNDTITGGDYSPTWEIYKTILGTDVDATYTSGFSSNQKMFMDRSDGNLVHMVQRLDLGGDDHFFKTDSETGAILWISENADFGNTTGGGTNDSLVLEGVYEWVSTSEVAYSIDLSDGTITQVESGYTCQSSGRQAYYSPARLAVAQNTASGAEEVSLLFIGRRTGLPTTVQKIVDDVVDKVGLAPADTDTSALAPLSLPGYMIPRNMQGRAALEPLSNFYLFDSVEVDDIIKFVVRGGAAAGTITEQSLVIAEDSAETFTEIRVAESELPAEVSVSYMDPDIDYNQNIHRAKRILLPKPEVQSDNKLNLQMPAALTPDSVKSQAMILLLSSWEGRISRSFTANRSFLKYIPSDVLTMTLDDGRTVRVRLANSEVKSNLEYELATYEEDSSQYSFPATADGGSGIPDQVIENPADLRLILVRSPLWRDLDDVGRSHSSYYFFMGAVGPGVMNLGLLYESPDDSIYSQIGSVTTEPTWGYATNALGDVAWDEKWLQDNTNTLNVVLRNELTTLSSVTLEQLVIGSTNAFALIHTNGDVELMKFQTVVAEADGSFTLSGLLRGRRGTDRNTAGHVGGNIFVVLDSTASIAPTTLGNVGVTKFLKPVHAGDLLEDEVPLEEANPANDLKPWAPVWVVSDGALWGSDIVFSWIRRTRVGGELRNLTGTVPISEDTEEYEAEIWDGATLKRTYLGLTTPTFTYTTAEQTADSWTPTEVSVIVYQVSAQVGRGFPSYKTVIQV